MNGLLFKSRLSFGLGILLLVLGLQHGAANAETNETWLFGSLGGWTGTNATVSIVGGALHIHPTSSDPQAISANTLAFTPTSTDYIRTNIHSANANGQFQIYFRNGNHGFQEANSKIYNITTDGSYHYYTIPLSGSHPNSQLAGMGDWGSGSTVSQLRLDPARSSSGDVDYDFVAVRQDDKDPYRPLINSISPPSWTTGTITISVQGNDPPPKGFSNGAANPDAYGSGVFDFGWRIDGGTETWQQYSSFPDWFEGTAYLTLQIAAASLPPGCHSLSVRSRDRCGRIGPARDTTLYVGPDPGYRITGRSTSFETGLAVAGDPITYGAQCGPISGQVTTDANGYYQTPALPMGKYSLGAGSCDDIAHACEFGNPVLIECIGNQTVNFRQKGLVNPTGLSVTPDADGTSFILTWDPGNEYTDHFRAYSSSSSEGPFVAVGNGQTSITASGYSCAQTVYFRIGAVNGCGREGQPCAAVPGSIPCPVVHGFVEDSVTQNAIAGASLTMSGGAGAVGTVTSGSSGEYSFTLPSGGTYSLEVSQPDGYWNFSESFAMDPLEDFGHVVSLLPVGVPTDVASVTKEEDNSILVTWHGTEAAVSRYELFSKVAALDDGTFALLATISAPDTMYIDRPTDGLAHDYKVRAVVESSAASAKEGAGVQSSVILLCRSRFSSKSRGEPVAGFGSTPPPRSVVAKNAGDSQAINVHIWPPVGAVNFAGIDQVLVDVFDHSICDQSGVPARSVSANPHGINGEVVVRVDGLAAGGHYAFGVRLSGKKGTSQPAFSACDGVRPQPPPCVLVHGFFSNREALEDFGKYLHKYGVGRVGTVEFACLGGGWSGWIAPLKQQIESALSPGGNWPYEETVDIVAHSQGGLASRGYIESGGNGRVRKLVMLGTPNHGAQMAALGASLIPTWKLACFGQGIAELSPTSSALRKLNYGPTSQVLDGFCMSSPVESYMLQRKGATQYYTVAGTAGGTSQTNNLGLGLLFQTLTSGSCKGDGIVPRRSVRLRGLGGPGNCGQWMDSELNAAGWGVGLLTHAGMTSPWSQVKSTEFVRSEPLAKFVAQTILAPNQSLALGSIQCNPSSSGTVIENEFDDPPAPDSIAILATQGGDLSPGASAVHQATLDACRRVTVVAVTDSTVPGMILVDPAGNRFSPADTLANDWLTYSDSDSSGYVAFGIEIPQSGVWHLELSNLGADPMPYQSTWIAEGSSIALSTATGGPTVEPGGAIPLRASLDPRPQSGVTVMTATVLDPAGGSTQLPLRDDGLSGDETADDGVFSSAFGTSPLPGAYRVQYEASVMSGTSQLLAREADTLITLAMQPDLALPEMTAAPALCEIGGTIHFTAKLKNLGNLGSGIALAFFDSTTAESIGVIKAVLAAGDSVELSLDWSPTARGEHRIGATVESPELADGDLENNSTAITVPVGGPAPVVAVPATAKLVFDLGRPMPNPSMGKTAFAFTLPAESSADLEIFDVRGRRLNRLVRGILPAGSHRVTWDNRNDDGRRVPAGVYFVRLTVGGNHKDQKLVIIN